MNSGIYAIINRINGKFYIGSAVDLKNRQRQHWSDLKIGKHRNPYLQNASNKYWLCNFEFIVLEYCNKTILYDLEQWWFNLTRCYDRDIGYNFHKEARSPLGVKHSEQSRKNMSEAHKDHKHTEEHKRKIGEGNKGKIISYETRIRMSDAQANNAYLRNYEKWPCRMGIRCKCNECREKRLTYSREWYQKKKLANFTTNMG